MVKDLVRCAQRYDTAFRDQRARERVREIEREREREGRKTHC